MAKIPAEEDPPLEALIPLARMQRDPNVEREIVEVLVLNSQQVMDRARIERDSDGFLREETLVYLIRGYHLLGKPQIVDDLTKVLVARCQPIFLKRLSSFDDMAAQQLAGNVIGDMIEKLLDFDSARGDFLQVRFLQHIKLRTIDEFKKYTNSGPKGGKKPDQPPTGVGSGITVEAKVADPLASKPQLAPVRDVERRAVGKDGLNAISDPRYKEAYILRHMHNWQIESDDLTKPTLSNYYGKTARTIRNWLQIAEQDLEAWRKAERNE